LYFDRVKEMIGNINVASNTLIEDAYRYAREEKEKELLVTRIEHSNKMSPDKINNDSFGICFKCFNSIFQVTFHNL